MDIGSVESIVLSAGITIFSLGLLFVSLLSYKRYKNPKLLFISLVFVVFLIKGVLLSLRLFFSELSVLDMFLSGPLSGAFDFFILALLFFATLKR